VAKTARVRLLLPDDVTVAAQSLTQAFADDPMVTWLLHGVSSGVHNSGTLLRQVDLGFFRPSVDIGRLRGHTYIVESDTHVRGVAVWAPPGTTVFDEISVATLTAAVSQHLNSQALERLSALGELCQVHHPHVDPHFYLYLLGVDPAGHGWGGPLMGPVLARCDADGLGAYLESSNARNHGFYRRLGFRPVWEARPDDHGPVMTGMWRDPQ